MNREILWNSLLDKGVVEGGLPEDQEYTPWFVRLLLGLCGWIAALFLSFFIHESLNFTLKEGFSYCVAGGAFIFFSLIFQYLLRKRILVAQFALAMCLSGQLLIFMGLLDFNFSARTVSLLLVLLELFLFIMVKNSILRLLSAVFGAAALYIVSITLGLDLYIGLLFFISLMLIWQREVQILSPGKLRSLGYGLFISLVILLLIGKQGLEFTRKNIESDIFNVLAPRGVLWVHLVITLALLVYLFRRIFPAYRFIPLILALVLAGVSPGLPGLTYIGAVIIVAFSQNNFLFLGLAVVSGLIYFVKYYYMLDLTLMEKSFWLMGTGLFFLVLRYVLKKREQVHE